MVKITYHMVMKIAPEIGVVKTWMRVRGLHKHLYSIRILVLTKDTRLEENCILEFALFYAFTVL